GLTALSAEFTIGEGELMAHDVPLGCAPDEYDDLISGTCSHLPKDCCWDTLFFAISALPETINLITKEAPGISGLKFDYNQIKICCRRA
ncbi:hypothetical protein ABEM53_05185, partial [Escherichia coli]|nr:hypothetical protein [Escherichia coli]MCS0854645.1 hypothetical protein [Escherichia coli]MEC3819568.1 hypothetical protein [Escherichia coli]